MEAAYQIVPPTHDLMVVVLHPVPRLSQVVGTPYEQGRLLVNVASDLAACWGKSVNSYIRTDAVLCSQLVKCLGCCS